jgi:hypothetical protein
MGCTNQGVVTCLSEKAKEHAFIYANDKAPRYIDSTYDEK